VTAGLRCIGLKRRDRQCGRPDGRVNTDMDDPNPDSPLLSATLNPLEAAHLAYMRADYENARRILDSLLAADPRNETALRLRDLAERAQADSCAAEAARECWLSRLQPSGIMFAGVVLLAVGFLALGAWAAVDPVRLALLHGLTGQARYPSGTVYISAPVHFLFARPLLLLAVGLYLSYTCLRHILSLNSRDSDRA
jgi:hypothetical protein